METVRKVAPPLINVLSANTAGQVWMDWPVRKRLAKKVFRACSASIAGFQEFGLYNWKTLKKGHPEMALLKGEEAGDIYINPIAFDSERFSLVHHETFWLSKNGSRSGNFWGGSLRGATLAKLRDFQYRPGREFRDILVVNFHLDNISWKARIEGVKVILRKIEAAYEYSKAELPTILTADTNVSIDSPFTRWKDPQKRSWQDEEFFEPIRLLCEANFIDTWEATHRGDPDFPPEHRPRTFHDFRGRHYTGDGSGVYDPDYVLVNEGFAALNSNVIEDSEGGVNYSDHYWVTTLLDYAA